MVWCIGWQTTPQVREDPSLIPRVAIVGRALTAHQLVRIRLVLTQTITKIGEENPQFTLNKTSLSTKFQNSQVIFASDLKL